MNFKIISLFLALGLLSAHAQQVDLTYLHPIVTITVIVTQDNGATHYSLNGTDYPTANAVMAAAAAEIKNRPGSPVVIQGSKDVPYAAVVQLLDEGRNHGIASISFAPTKTPAPAIASSKRIEPSIHISNRDSYTVIVTLDGIDYPISNSAQARTALETQLKTEFAQDPHASCIIHADTKVGYTQARDLVSLFQKVGFHSVNLVAPVDGNMHLPGVNLPTTSNPAPHQLSFEEVGEQTSAAHLIGVTGFAILFGIALTVFSLIAAAIAVTIFLYIRHRRSRHEKELRRIASLDS